MSNTTEIVKSKQFLTVVETAQSALIKNQQSVEKAKEAGQAILDTIEAEGMSDEMDLQCNNFLVKIRKTDALLKERRNPVTQLFDTIRKTFTSLEGDMKEVAEQIKGKRDDYAKFKAEEQRKKEAEAQRKLNIEKEKATVAAEAETALSRHFNTILVGEQNKLLKCFDETTLDTFDASKEAIVNWSLVMDLERFKGLGFGYNPIYITKGEATVIIKQAVETKAAYYGSLYHEKMLEYRQELSDKLPSKKTELEAIAEAEKKNAEEAARLKAERAEREKAEKERLEREAKEREEKERQEAEAKKQEVEMESLFNATEETAVTGSQAQVRAGFDITVTHPAGYVQIFQLWFEKEGKNLGVDVAGRKSLNQMKTFCEKYAHKTGEKITSPYVKYEESFSTVARA